MEHRSFKSLLICILCLSLVLTGCNLIGGGTGISKIPTSNPASENVENTDVGTTAVATEPESSETEELEHSPTESSPGTPSESATEEPTEAPAEKPTEASTEKPTETPAEKPTETPTEKPTETPAEKPTEASTEKPTEAPTEKPTEAPTEKPTEAPTEKPTEAPTEEPTEAPTEEPEPELPQISSLPKEAASIINTIRAAGGLPEFTYRSDMQAAANIRAAELTTHFSHSRPDGSSWTTVQETANVEFSMPCASLIFSGISNADDLDSYIRNDSSFNKYIYSEEYAGIVIGIAESNGKYYWEVILLGPTVRDTTGFIDQVFAIVNSERAAAGLSPLTYCTELQAGANIRAAEMLTKYDHVRPNGTGFSTVYAETNVEYLSAGENIAYGQTTPDEVMLDWMNSPGHRANILGDFTGMAVGVSQRNGRIYWVQLFITQ